MGKLIALLFDGDKRRWHFAMHSPLINFFSMEPITASANLQTRIEIRSKNPQPADAGSVAVAQTQLKMAASNRTCMLTLFQLKEAF